jgi:hypothetical protein
MSAHVPVERSAYRVGAEGGGGGLGGGGEVGGGCQGGTDGGQVGGGCQGGTDGGLGVGAGGRGDGAGVFQHRHKKEAEQPPLVSGTGLNQSLSTIGGRPPMPPVYVLRIQQPGLGLLGSAIVAVVSCCERATAAASHVAWSMMLPAAWLTQFELPKSRSVNSGGGGGGDGGGVGGPGGADGGVWWPGHQGGHGGGREGGGSGEGGGGGGDGG